MNDKFLNFEEALKATGLTRKQFEAALLAGKLIPRVMKDGILREVCAFRDKDGKVCYKLRE